MRNFKRLLEIISRYKQGENIIEYLNKSQSQKRNEVQDILISYDLQSSQYLKSLSDNISFKKKYCQSLANKINGLGDFDSILEVGIGEGTTIGVLNKYLNNNPSFFGGFDLSWSRVKYAKHFFEELNLPTNNLFCANLFNIPLKDNSIEVVFTSHSIEPNGGKEEQALKELIRVTKDYLILLEPAYELSNTEAQHRMDKHGYIKGIKETAIKLGLEILEHRLFDYSASDKNPTGITIIKKNKPEVNKKNKAVFICPITKTTLEKINENLFFSKEGLLSYPIINSIPYLLEENAVLTSHLQEDYNEIKAKKQIKEFRNLI